MMHFNAMQDCIIMGIGKDGGGYRGQGPPVFNNCCQAGQFTAGVIFAIIHI